MTALQKVLAEIAKMTNAEKDAFYSALKVGA